MFSPTILANLPLLSKGGDGVGLGTGACGKGDIGSLSPYPSVPPHLPQLHHLTRSQDSAAVAAAFFQSPASADILDRDRAVMEDTRARWDRAYVEALDFDTWGQVGNAGEAPPHAAMDSTSMHAPME